VDQPEIVTGWTDAVPVWDNLENRYPKSPSQVQRESIQRRLAPKFAPVLDHQSSEYVALVELVRELEIIQSVPSPNSLPCCTPRTQIPRLRKSDQVWTNVLRSLKLVFDSLKHQNVEWRAEHESITRQQETGQRAPPRFSRRQDLAEAGRRAEPRRTEWE
jgi:hypothetical protein